jgi:hypothetical protein
VTWYDASTPQAAGRGTPNAWMATSYLENFTTPETWSADPWLCAAQFAALGYTGPTCIDMLNDVDSSSTNPEDTLGVIRSDGTLKPVAYVIAQLAAQRDTTPAMAQLTLAMPGAAVPDPAAVATLTKLADPPDAAAVTPADAAAVAQLATATTPAPTDPAAVMAANMNAMAGAMGKQLEASADAAGTALQASVQAAATGF